MAADGLSALLDLFVLDAPRRLATIEWNLDALDRSPAEGAPAAAAALEVHSLLGAAATLRLEPIATLAERLELTLRGTDARRVARARELLAALRVSVADLERAPAQLSVSPEAAATQPPQQRSVLQVEDNSVDARLVERVLARRPQVRLLTATRADAGLRLARDERPALVLLDLNLADATGREFLTRLREDPTTSATPVVVVSADAELSASAALRELGVRECLTKPVDVGRLLELVDELAT